MRLLAIFAVLTFMLILLNGCTPGSLECSSVHRNTGKPTKYSLMTGCYVLVDGQWTPLHAWRVQ